ncbi:MAG: hypothetical protein V3S11_06055 [Elusimicrobiota bacterium]
MPSKKDDLPVTKNEFMAQIVKLDDKFYRMSKAWFAADSRIDRLERSLNKKIDKNTDRILGAIDAFARKAETYDRKALSHGSLLQDHIALLKQHGMRIDHIEALLA